MPSYYYKARDLSGRAHEGIEVAASEDEVLRILENSKLVPVLIEHRAPAGAPAAGEEIGARMLGSLLKFQERVSTGSVALFARQLATMIGVGLPLVRSLRSIARDHYDKKLRVMLEKVADDVQKGESLSSAMAKHPGPSTRCS